MDWHQMGDRALDWVSRPFTGPPAPVLPPPVINANRPPATGGEIGRAGQPKPQPANPPPRACTICCDAGSSLIKACRVCPADYCSECLMEMFENSLKEGGIFPPRCCSFVQLYTVLADFPKEAANKYRLKFEEWMTVDKVYCPVPTCSAFIPAKELPLPTDTAKRGPSLQDVLTALVGKLAASPNVRFFTGDFLNLRARPDYQTTTSKTVDLKTIRTRLKERKYASTASLTNDVCLIVDNALGQHGMAHPISIAAESLRTEYYGELSKVIDNFTKQGPLQVRDMFACPSCHIALCSSCREVEHHGRPCDSTKGDEEVAMLASFGYKRCPKCKHGVRRMYGCSHMQCACGAHWCWWCLRSIDECMGDCGGPQDGESDGGEEEEGMYEEEDEEDEDGDSTMIEPANGPDPPHSENAPGAAALDQDTNQNDPGGAHTPASALRPPVNLDAGGFRRWAEAGLNFGNEPDDGDIIQVWSCRHNMRLFKVPEDAFNHGNLDLMECNRCFKPVKPPPKKRRSKQNEDDQPAWECTGCRLIVCSACKDLYEKGE